MTVPAIHCQHQDILLKKKFRFWLDFMSRCFQRFMFWLVVIQLRFEWPLHSPSHMIELKPTQLTYRKTDIEKPHWKKRLRWIIDWLWIKIMDILSVLLPQPPHEKAKAKRRSCVYVWRPLLLQQITACILSNLHPIHCYNTIMNVFSLHAGWKHGPELETPTGNNNKRWDLAFQY